MRIKDRIRRRLRGLHKNYPELQAIRELINLSVSRPVDLLDIQDSISKSDELVLNKIRSIEKGIEKLQEIGGCEQECKNIIVATIRYLEFEDINHCIDFGMKYLQIFPDQRGLATMVSILESEGKQNLAIQILKSHESTWSTRKLAMINAAIGLTYSENATFKANVEKMFLQNEGMDYLTSNHAPTVLLYGDVNLNVIDGSSVWLSSLIEAFSLTGLDVHILLKSNISRDLLTAHLASYDNIKWYEPSHFGINEEQLSIREAVDIIEVLDGLSGGYRTIVLRGYDLCIEAGGRQSFWKRIWAYLTDFYHIDEQKGLIIDNEIKITLNDLQHMFEYFLIQTEELGEILVDMGINQRIMQILPPMIPDRMTLIEKSKKPNKVLKIGYCGKIAPMWGVRELIQSAENLVKKGKNVEVHIIGDKIHKNTKAHPNFRQEMLNLLENSHVVVWHGAVGRDNAIELLAGYDLGWCYRDTWFEKNTLELSTKLLEYLSIDLPFIVTRNNINEKLLGKDYPYFVDDANKLDSILEEVANNPPNLENMNHLLNPYLLSTISKEKLLPLLEKDNCNTMNSKKIVISGTDLKFISQFESFLKKNGCIVRRDYWEWGGPQFIQRTQKLSQWADYIFCEWSLANAVWYSKNLRGNQHLIIRLHSQEIRKRASKFPKQLSKPNNIVFVAEHIREKAIQQFNWKQMTTFMIPNFVNCQRLNKKKKRSAKKTIGMIGVVPKSKRLDRALDLIQKLRSIDDEWTLIIKGKLPHDYSWMSAPGRSDEKDYFEKQFKRIEKNAVLKEGIIFEKFSPRIAEFYSKIGYVLSPSDFESFHFSIADGVASGAFPVIWPWDGAEKLYPKEWIITDTEMAIEKILNYSQLLDEEKSVSVEHNRQIISKSYDIDVIFEKLRDLLLVSSK